jgi:(R,R)-butanediol dehydrogenase/meso-butanediol dehydrogenase/diacetyl reductase
MRAAVQTDSRTLEVQELPVPQPAPDEVLLEVHHCGVCGTDLHFVLEGWGAPGSVHGHEYAGRIVSVGSDVEGFTVGDRVVGGPRFCGTCRNCLRGRPALCSARPKASELSGELGAFAQYTTVHAGALHRIPDDMDSRTAALTEPLAVAQHGITRSGARPGDTVLVIGAGPIGLLSVAALKAAGIDDITVSEPSALRRQAAERLGARSTVTPDELVAPFLPFDFADPSYDVVLECSGKSAAMESGIAQLAAGGTIVLVGSGIIRPALDAMRVLLTEITITGAYEYDVDGFATALATLASGSLPVDLLLHPDDVGLGGLQAALQGLAAGEITAKVLVTPN